MPSGRRRLGWLAALLWLPAALGFGIALHLGEGLVWTQALVAGTMSTIPGAVLGVFVVRACVQTPWRSTSRTGFILRHMAGALAYSVLWSAAIVFEMGVSAPPGEMAAFLTRGLVWQLLTGIIVYAVIAGATYARVAVVEAEESARAAERAEMLRLRAELGALRARLEPHFLFNVLQTLGALIDEQPRKAHEALEHLAALLKRRIDPSSISDDLVPLADELADVRQYLALESLRYGSRLATRENMDAVTLSYTIPRFTLQPLVENAIHHGLSPRAAGGQVTIASTQNGSSWILTVADDGAGGDASGMLNGNGIGLSVVRERLRLRFGDNASVNVRTSPGAGCTVTLHLPVDALDSA